MILDAVLLRLVALFTAAVTVPVYDGPFPPAVNSPQFVLVGSTGEQGDDGASVEFELSELGPGTWHNETGQIICSAWAWDGGTDVPARRAEAEAAAMACIGAVWADRTLGGLLHGAGIAQATGIRYQPQQTDRGAICRFLWTVTYTQHLNT
jgi:hypothetical protein